MIKEKKINKCSTKRIITGKKKIRKELTNTNET